MNLIVVGCGRVGAGLAYRLSQQGHRVTVMDIQESAFDILPPDFRGRTIVGEVLSQEVLERAGIGEADGIAAVTSSDSTNAVVCHVAHRVYGVDNVVVRNYDPRWLALQQDFGFQVISSASWGAQRIEELLSDSPLRTVFSAGNGEVEVYELKVPPPWDGHSLTELMTGLDAVAVAVTRAGRSALPAEVGELRPGDLLHVGATREAAEQLQARLAAPPEG
jgi:trk system potassium uptake protein TrkA